MTRGARLLSLLLATLFLSGCAPEEGDDIWDARFENGCDVELEVTTYSDRRPFKTVTVGPGDIRLVRDAFDRDATHQAIAQGESRPRRIWLKAPSDVIPDETKDTYIVLCQ